jgi:DNA-binding transcriptional LysR family regulator
MKMNFNHLLIFQKVAEKEHFTRAAEALFISQPAVSKQIQELEKACQQPLFTCVGQRVHLTEAGRVLYAYANRIFALAKEAEMVMDEMNDLQRGHLSIGASTTIGTYLLPELLSAYKKRYTHIELSVSIANTEEIQDAVRMQRLEVGIVEGEVIYPELASQEWQQDELVCVVSPHGELAQVECLDLHQLFSMPLPLIVRERGSGTREVMEHALLNVGIVPPTPAMERGSTEAIKRVVSAGLGWAFVSKHTIQLELQAGLLKILPVDSLRITRVLSIVLPKDLRVFKATQAFLDFITDIPLIK